MTNHYTSSPQAKNVEQPKSAEQSEKVQAVMAKAGWCSRRAGEKAIAEGKVKVNGLAAHVGQRVTSGDTINFENKTLTLGAATTSPLNLRLFLLNKPKDVISTTQDELGRNDVVSLLPPMKERLYPVGRLDKDSKGLMILTNDGNLAYRLTHPKFEVEKEYHALLDRKPTYNALEFLKNSVTLDGEYCPVDDIDILESSDDGCLVTVTIHQGKNHHVKRLFKRAGYEVLELTRVRFGPFDLNDLQGKRWKEVSADDYDLGELLND
jgi:23S rRNA pseudouridine2605 synthase